MVGVKIVKIMRFLLKMERVVLGQCVENDRLCRGLERVRIARTIRFPRIIN